MRVERTFTTNAFSKYIDSIFIIENNLMWVAPRKLDDRLDVRFRYRLDSYRDEQDLRAGMCYELARRISTELNFENTKSIYNKKMLDLASNYNLDNTEIEKSIKKLQNTLLAHAKLQYCFENYLNKITKNNDLSILACLISLKLKISKIKKEKNPTETIEDVAKTKWYKYVKAAMLEEQGFDIKNYAKCSLQELSEILFDLVVQSQYDLDNVVTETSVSTDSKTILLDVYALEENNDYADYKNEIEQKIDNWLFYSMHTLDNGQLF